MDFIEALLEEISDVSAAEIIDVAMEKWGEVEYDFGESRLGYPDFITDLMYIAYLDKAVHISGLEYYILNCDKIMLQNTIHAFRKINDEEDANILEAISNMSEVRKFYAGKAKSLPESATGKIVLFETLMYFSLEQTNMWYLLEKYIERGIYSYSLLTKNGLKN